MVQFIILTYQVEICRQILVKTYWWLGSYRKLHVANSFLGACGFRERVFGEEDIAENSAVASSDLFRMGVGTSSRLCDLTKIDCPPRGQVW
jgi:hypothetical protein